MPSSPTPGELRARLEDPQLTSAERLKLLIELRENIEWFQSTDYQQFLDQLIPCFEQILTTLTRPQLEENAEQALRRTVLEVLSRLPHGEALRPHARRLLQMCQYVLDVDDAEPNAVLALQIMFECHKAYRPQLAAAIPPFLDFVLRIYGVFEWRESDDDSLVAEDTGQQDTYLEPGLEQDGSVEAASRNRPTNVRYAPALRSYRTVRECPPLFMYLSQHYPALIEPRLDELLAVMVRAIEIQVPPTSPARALPIYHDFITAQMKTVSFISFLLRQFESRMLQYAERVPRSVVNLLLNCPDSAVSIRKELLIASRHLLATEFRRGFFLQTDLLLDEKVLIGTSRAAYETLRPLAYSFLAELVHFVRLEVTLPQLSRIIYLFSTNVHDASLSFSMQATSIRLLLNLIEGIMHRREDLNTRGRQLLERIFETIVTKLMEVAEVVPSLLVSTGAADGNDAEDKANGSASSQRASSPIPEPSASTETGAMRPSAVPDEKSQEERSKEVQECRQLVRTLVLGLKTIVWSMSNAFGDSRTRGLTEWECILVSRMLPAARTCFQLYKFGEPAEQKEILDQFAQVFTVMTPRNFQDIIGGRLPQLLAFMVEHQTALSIPQHFLANTSTSRFFADILITFLTEHLEQVVSDDAARASVLLRLFKIMFASVTLFADNEPVLKPHLGTIVRRCLELAATAENPTNALQVLRALFKSLAGGRFELLYREFVPMLYYLLHSLERLMQGPLGESHGLLLIELCLTAPARPSTIFPYLRMHMRPLVRGLDSESELTSLSFRTFEFWIDTLHPEVLERLMQAVQPELERALWRYLSPTSPFSAQAVRILGKLGGLNRKTPRELTPLPWQQPVQAIHAALAWCDRAEPLTVALDEVINAAVDAVLFQASYKVAAYTLLQQVMIAALSSALPPQIKGCPADLLPASVYTMTSAFPRLQVSKTIYTRMLTALFFASGDDALQQTRNAVEFARQLCDYFCRIWMAPVLMEKSTLSALEAAALNAHRTPPENITEWTRFPAAVTIDCFLDALVEAAVLQQKTLDLAAAAKDLNLFALSRCVELFKGDFRGPQRPVVPASDAAEVAAPDSKPLTAAAKGARATEAPSAETAATTAVDAPEHESVDRLRDDHRGADTATCVDEEIAPPLHSVAGASRLTEQLALLVERISHLGYRERWQDRLSCAMLLAGIIEQLPTVVFLDRSYCLYEARLVRVLLQVLKGCAQEGMASRKPAPLVRQTLETLLRRCHEPTSPAWALEDVTSSTIPETDRPSKTNASTPRARCGDVVACLVFDLASEHQAVRETVHASLAQLLRYGVGQNMAEVLALAQTQILRPLLSRRVRTLHYSSQVGHVDCLHYCLENGIIRPFIDQETSLLRTSLVAAMEIFEDPINTRLGEADALMLNRLLENRFVDQETITAIVMLREKVLQFLALCLRQIDQLVHTPNEDIRSLYARLVACFFRGVESRHEAVTRAAKHGLRVFTERSRQLPRGILSSNLRPILQNLSDTNKLSLPYAQTLANVLEVLSNWFNVQLGERLVEHLMNLRAGNPRNPSLLAARIIDLFHLLPPAASRFLDRLIAIVLSFEDEMGPADTGAGHHGLQSRWAGSMSPYRAPLLRYLEKHANLAIGYFLERIRFANYALLFQSLLRAHNAENLRRELANDVSRFIAATFDRGHLLQGLLIVDALESFQAGWIATQRPIYNIALQIWQSAERLERLRREETLPVDQLAESSLLAHVILAYCAVHHGEVDGLYALLSIFSLRTLRDFSFVRRFLTETVAQSYPILYRKKIVERFLERYLDPELSDEVKMYALLYLVIPILRQAFRAGEGLAILDAVTLEVLVKRLFTSTPPASEALTDASADGGGGGDTAPMLASPAESDVLGEALLQLSTLLIEEMPIELVQYRREIIRFGWNYLKRDDSIAKPWAFLNVARFFEAYQAPEKIVLQVFVALLRASQSEQRALVRQALRIVTSILPSRLPATLGKARHAPWIRFTKKILVEESYSALHLAHIWSLVIDKQELFFPGYASLMPHMVNSLPRLVSGSVSAREHRRLALELAGLVVAWQQRLLQVGNNASISSNAPSENGESANASPQTGSAPMASPDVARRLEDLSAVTEVVLQFLIRLPFLVSEPGEHTELFTRARSLLVKAQRVWNHLGSERSPIAQMSCLDKLLDNLAATAAASPTTATGQTSASGTNTAAMPGAPAPAQSHSTTSTISTSTTSAGAASAAHHRTANAGTASAAVAPPNNPRDAPASRAREALARSRRLVLEHIVELCELFLDWQGIRWILANSNSLRKLVRPVLAAGMLPLAYRFALLLCKLWLQIGDALRTPESTEDQRANLETVRRDLEQALFEALDIHSDTATLHRSLLLAQTLDPERFTTKHVELIVRILQILMRECLAGIQTNRRMVLIPAPASGDRPQASSSRAQLGTSAGRSSHPPEASVTGSGTGASWPAATGTVTKTGTFSTMTRLAQVAGESAPLGSVADPTASVKETKSAHVASGDEHLPAKGGFEYPGVANPLLVCLEILERLFHGLADYRRSFLQMLWVLLDKCCYSEVLMHVVRVLSQWILMDADDPGAFLQPKEKVHFLVKMTVFERITGAEAHLEAFLPLVLRLLAEPCHALPRDWLPRLERPFMIGLRASNPQLRQAFFQLLDESIIRNPVDRLYYIFEYQSWESLADSLWIRQATALLLALVQVPGSRIELTPDCVRLGCVSYRSGTAADDAMTWEVSRPGADAPTDAADAPRETLTKGAQRSPTDDAYVDAFAGAWTALDGHVDTNAFFEALHELLHHDVSTLQSLWTQLFGAVWSLLSDREERLAMQDALIALLCRDYLLTQCRWRVNVVQIILDAATKCAPQVVIPPQLALHLATHWNAWHIALTYLERRSRSSTLGVARHSDFVFDSLPDGHEFAGILDAKAELYRQLNEYDLYIGLWKRRAMDSRTLLALSLEQQGHLPAAQNLYYDAMTNTESRVAVTEAEAALWEDRWLHCAEELNQWDALTEFSRTVMHPTLLHEALWRLPDWAALKELLMKMPPEDSPRLKILQSFVQLQENRLDQVEPFISSGIRRALEEWQGLPENSSITAFEPSLVLFQQFVELSESASILQELNNALQNPTLLETHAENIRLVLAMWRDRQANHWDRLSDWNRLICWRNHVLTAVVHTLQGLRNRSRVDIPQPLLCMGINETAWNVNCYARAARKQRLSEVCMQALQRMYPYSTMDVQDFFMKTKEQAKAHLLLPSNDDVALRAGLVQLQHTNREYFNTRQKAYLSALEGEFYHRLGEFGAANQAFASSVREYGEHGGVWLRWARYCDQRGRLASAVHCYLQGIRFGSRQAREHLVSVFRIVFALDGASSNAVADSSSLEAMQTEQAAATTTTTTTTTGTADAAAPASPLTTTSAPVAVSSSSAAVSAGASAEVHASQTPSEGLGESRTDACDVCESFVGVLPVWIWVPWSHELISLLSLGRELKLLRHILLRVAGYYPEALFFQLRTFIEERRLLDRPTRMLCPRVDQIQLPVMHPLRSQVASGIPPSSSSSSSTSSAKRNDPTTITAAAAAAATTAGADRSRKPESTTTTLSAAGNEPSSVAASAGNTAGNSAQKDAENASASGANAASTGATPAPNQPRGSGTSALPSVEQNILSMLQLPLGDTPFEIADTVLAFMVKQHPQLLVELETIARELSLRMKPSAEEQVLHVLNALLHRCWSLPPLMHREVSSGMRSALEEVSKMCFGTGLAADEFHVPPTLADLREAFEAELAPQTAKNFPKTIEPFVALLRKWRGIFSRRVQAMPETLRLERVSRKLVDVRDSQLHVFGQLIQLAQEDGEPLPDLLVHIQSFSVDVQVVHHCGSSARGIAVTGSDGRQYRFLVETALGASLQRSEDRVGHVCRFMNALFQRDSEARRRRLVALVPFSLPLSPQARLVAYQENTLRIQHALQAFCECHGFDMDDTLVAFRDTCALRLESLGNVASRELALEYRLDAFKRACLSLPDSVLAHWAAASLPDANSLFMVRKRFALSLGTSSLLLYLLGVGSRTPMHIGIHGSTGDVVHLETHPIVVSRGQQVYIGFDEAVPFRLTRNIRSLIRLTGVEGPFAGSIAATLNVVYRNWALLRDLMGIVYTMELFERTSRETLRVEDLAQAVEESLVRSWARVEPLPFSAAPLVQSPTAPAYAAATATANGKRVPHPESSHGGDHDHDHDHDHEVTQTLPPPVNTKANGLEFAERCGPATSVRDEPEGVARRVAELIANAGDPAHLSQMEPLWYPWF